MTEEVREEERTYTPCSCNRNTGSSIPVRKLFPIFYSTGKSPDSERKRHRHHSEDENEHDLHLKKNKDKIVDTIDPKRRRLQSDCEEVIETPRRPLPSKRKRIFKENKEQLYLDLGQKKFGHVCCRSCGMIYTYGQTQDSVDHYRFHQTLMKGISFQGWKKERIIERYPEGRIIVVLPSDPKQHQKKIDDIISAIDCELGYTYRSEDSRSSNKFKTFLYISNHKEVIGFVMAEQIKEAYRLLVSDNENKVNTPSSLKTWCCSETSEEALVGINRIWVLSCHRRKGLATQLMDAVRKHFIFAYTVPKHLVAFSDPTPNGKSFASRYCETNNILVYKWMTV